MCIIPDLFPFIVRLISVRSISNVPGMIAIAVFLTPKPVILRFNTII